jgi:hypothetical protein
LVVFLSIIQGCMNMWYAHGHIINCSILLDVVDSPTIWLPMREIPQKMFFSTSPTFQWLSLCTISPSQGWSKSFISTLRWESLLIHTFTGKYLLITLLKILKIWWFNPLLLES